MKNSMMYRYNPTVNIREGLEKLIPYEMCPWDDYFPAMGQTDFLLNRHTLQSSKTFFYRKAPFGGSYALFGGLCQFLNQMKAFSYIDVPRLGIPEDTALAALKDQGYSLQFLKYLELRPKPKVKVYAPKEGSVILPNEPVVIVEGDLLSVRIVEGMMRCFNFASLSMTKWHRVCRSVGKGSVLEFARRRSQNHIETSVYAHLGGADATSNSEVRKGLDIKVLGTMGHEWVQSFGDEFEAFDKWLEHNPNKPVLLIDTIDTLKSGLPNAIKAFNKHKEKISRAKGVPGIRLDSGDLAYLAVECRNKLDYADLKNAKIVLTNDLDEYAITSIIDQIEEYGLRTIPSNAERVLSSLVWAAGTKPGTCYDQPSLGGVAKLGTIEKDRKMKSVIKIAKDNPVKTSIPGNNRSSFIWDGDDLLCCLIHGKDEDVYSVRYACHPDDESKRIDLNSYSNLKYELRQKCVYDWQKDMGIDPTIENVRNHVSEETERLHWSNLRLNNPHPIKVSLSESIFNLRKKMINNFELIEG